jgi:tubulin-folding cofactor B
MQTAHDIPLLITSENSSSERRVTPAWSIAQFKTKLEPITGIPPSAQRLTLRVPGQGDVAIQSADDEATQIGSFPLVAYGELHVRFSQPSRDMHRARDFSHPRIGETL